MAFVNVTEYASISYGVLTEPSIKTSVLDTASGAVSLRFSNETKFIRLVSDAVVYVKFGGNPVASPSSMRVYQNTPEYFNVTPESKIAVVSS